MSSNDAPKLLAGGNPQIPKGEGPGPVRDDIAAMPGWKHDVGQLLDSIIEQTVPGARRAVKWNTPFDGAPDRAGWFEQLSLHTSSVLPGTGPGRTVGGLSDERTDRIRSFRSSLCDS